nr:retrotransposon protein, putative, Ty3-gypsy subclass [Tanacetum cinerariifolium]
MTRSAGRPVAESRGGGMGVRVGRGGRGRRPRKGGSYKKFLACNPKEYDGKGGVVVLTASSFVGKALTWWNSQIRMLSQEVAISMSWNDFKNGHAAYTDRFHELSRLVPHLVTPESRMFESALTDEAIRNGSIKKVEKIGNVGEPSKDKSGRDDNKRTRNGNVFATTMNLVRRENTGVPRNANPVNARNLTVRACYECGRTDHVMSVCPKLNRAQGPKGNRPNQVAAINGFRVVETKGTRLGVGHSYWEQRKLAGFEHYDGYRRWIELFSDYDCEIRYHPGKANVVVDALSRKKRVKTKRVRDMNMTFQSSKDRILTTQKEAVVESVGLQKAYKSKYSLHPEADKMYYDLRDRYWWPGMKKDITEYAEVREGQLIGPKLVQETTEKISQIKDRLKDACDRHKSYADKMRKPLEFSVGDYVLLKVSPWKGVVRFEKKEKLAPRFVRHFEIIEKVGHVAFRLDFPEELNGVHDTFYVSNLKKCDNSQITHVFNGVIC